MTRTDSRHCHKMIDVPESSSAASHWGSAAETNRRRASSARWASNPFLHENAHALRLIAQIHLGKMLVGTRANPLRAALVLQPGNCGIRVLALTQAAGRIIGANDKITTPLRAPSLESPNAKA